jgi:hypothetical protein
MSSTGVPSTISTPQKYTEDPATHDQGFIDNDILASEVIQLVDMT